MWLITKGEVGCSGRVNSSCSTCGTRCFSLVNPVINHKWGNDRLKITTNGYLGSSPVFSGVRVARFLYFSVVVCRLLFVLLSVFVLAIVLSVLIRITASDYSFSCTTQIYTNLLTNKVLQFISRNIVPSIIARCHKRNTTD